MNRLHHLYCRTAHWRSTLEQLVPWALADVDLGDRVLELGPGPGRVMPLLTSRLGTTRITAIDNDAASITALRRQKAALDLVRGDATELPFAISSFSAVIAFTMLHHIPTRDLQQQLFREVSRTLRPGGVFVGMDARFSVGLWLFHLGDTCSFIPPDEAGPRLAAAGFVDIAIERRPGFFRFRARSPGTRDVARRSRA